MNGTDLAQHILTVFFDRVPTIPKMFHRATFFANLALPPKRPEFPVSAKARGLGSDLSTVGDAATWHSRSHGPLPVTGSARVACVLSIRLFNEHCRAPDIRQRWGCRSVACWHGCHSAE